MSNQPQARSLVYSKVHRAYMTELSDGIPHTTMLISVDDREWIAWYLFHERNSSRVMDQDLMNGRDQDLIIFGQQGAALANRLSNPRRVDEFATGKERGWSSWKGNGSVPAQLHANLQERGKLRMRLYVIMNTVTARLELELNHVRTNYRPGQIESGTLELLQIERYLTVNYNDSLRFKPWIEQGMRAAHLARSH